SSKHDHADRRRQGRAARVCRETPGELERQIKRFWIFDFGFWIGEPGELLKFPESVVISHSDHPKSKMENRLLMGDGLRRNAGKFPLKVAAKDNAGQITYGELNARVNRLAHGLLSLGVRKGDEVAVSVGNRIEHLEILFATAKIGALAIPLDVKWKALELASVLSAFAP